eukprot:scaffold33623_cov59-Phaeocystis_antarctica.AAC.5
MRRRAARLARVEEQVNKQSSGDGIAELCRVLWRQDAAGHLHGLLPRADGLPQLRRRVGVLLELVAQELAPRLLAMHHPASPRLLELPRSTLTRARAAGLAARLPASSITGWRASGSLQGDQLLVRSEDRQEGDGLILRLRVGVGLLCKLEVAPLDLAAAGSLLEAERSPRAR